MASSPPHVFLLPFPAYGLMMIPMANLASLFASHGIHSTIITTSGKASSFPSHLDLLLLPSSPFTEVSLPSGCENLADLPQPEHQHLPAFMHAMLLLRELLAALLAKHSLTCLVSDYRCPWTVDMDIPRIIFQPAGAFSAAMSDIINTTEPHRKVEDPMEQFLIPGELPHTICITGKELPRIFNHPREVFQSTKESQCRSLGVIFHTFYELEPWYVDYLKASGPEKVCQCISITQEKSPMHWSWVGANQRMARFEETWFCSLHLLRINLCSRGSSTCRDSSRTTGIETSIFVGCERWWHYYKNNFHKYHFGNSYLRQHLMKISDSNLKIIVKLLAPIFRK